MKESWRLAVWQLGDRRAVGDLEKIHRLLSNGRVDFVAPANYEENSQLDIIVKGFWGASHRCRRCTLSRREMPILCQGDVDLPLGTASYFPATAMARSAVR
jgi:hypothetical protein